MWYASIFFFFGLLINKKLCSTSCKHASYKIVLICFNSNIIYDLSSSFCIYFHVRLPSTQTLSKHSVIFSFFLLYLVVHLFGFFMYIYIYIYILTFTLIHFIYARVIPFPLLQSISRHFLLLFRVLQFVLLGTALYYIETKLNTASRLDIHTFDGIHSHVYIWALCKQTDISTHSYHRTRAEHWSWYHFIHH
jgi:hypothetical protein